MLQRRAVDVAFLICCSIARPSVAQTSATPTSTPESKPKVIRLPEWGLELTVAGYEPSFNPNLKTSLTSTMNWGETNSMPETLLSAKSSGTCPMSITLLVRRMQEPVTTTRCRELDPFWAPKPLSRLREVEGLEATDTPVPHMKFEMKTGGARDRVSHLMGYWTRGDHCFIMSLTSSDCANLSQNGMGILQSVRILEDTGATQETLKLSRAKEGPGDPRDWHLHSLAAGLYLHSAKPPQPASARRFYESALQLGAGKIESLDMWGIQEGLGLSWLMQDDGLHALPPLEKALSASEGVRDPGARRETRRNLACAHALIGQPDLACSQLKELLGEQDPTERKLYYEEKLRKDPQLKPLKGSGCYKRLEEELSLR